MGPAARKDNSRDRREDRKDDRNKSPFRSRGMPESRSAGQNDRNSEWSNNNGRGSWPEEGSRAPPAKDWNDERKGAWDKAPGTNDRWKEGWKEGQGWAEHEAKRSQQPDDFFLMSRPGPGAESSAQSSS